MAYIYRHIRLDTNQVFYIGMGETNDPKHKRAYTKSARNKMWHGVVKKTRIEIEIMIEDLTVQEALQKEIELIALYKRKMDGGTLVNITIGGDGARGLPVSEETRRKQSLAKKGKPGVRTGTKQSLEARAKMSVAKKGKISWNKGIPQREETKVKWKKAMEGKFRTGSSHHAYGKPMLPHVREALLRNPPEKIWNKGLKHTDELRKIFTAKNRSQQKPVIQIEDGLEVARFHSVTLAAFATGLPRSSIAKCAGGTMKKCGGFNWLYS